MSLRLKLHNTLTREKADFQPIDANNVRMYVCGPTVYDFAHIGNARPVIVFDVLYRLLRHVYGDAHVTYARNITDVDDKINARALRDYPNLPLNDAIHAVTKKTAQQFHDDVAMLGCLEPTVEPRATDNISQMIEIIEKLIARGHAYVASGEVLFDTKSMGDYGQLSKRPLDEQQAGARVAVEVHKKSPGDFVLWKLSSHNEPGWESPWGRGRPGWHIECSAMSERYLGETFDIHGGGLDLIFPHHENEIAQSRCAHGTHVMANVWMHNGFVQVEGRKMSKSDGNFITIHELLHTEKFGGRNWPGEVLRLAMLMTHYREPIDFSVKRLEEAYATLLNWKEAMLNKGLSWQDGSSDYYADIPPSSKFIEALANDLNSSAAIAELHRLSKSNSIEDGHAMFANLSLVGVIDFESMQVWEVEEERKSVAGSPLSSAVDALVAMRLEMLKAKNFAEADRIRDELSGKGIQLKDGKDKDSGERVTTWEIKR
ncbi:cysteine--tRNA ligase [Agrobacterium rubi TR3 = NBRC 13261]|uniref:Cysteine--tRNA ligase n=1 Tax=Agrobacterium rubi TR3 = NBRC 13261 TaxID=1368415 RepID=A0A081D0D2_9HYPH|nr:cysteine--tRNA ligase [Agrobacterium rubi]MBP1878321.1 cysteinyl-tRNA synthetase [Agrobacterium rubi]MCL6653635.1 cysteine--tRNA ligase [Agrobacterium rubi]GAK72378.1 cysteine--tRNA ligase [Agrobacterium rubi TR3 = NBRC 13261]